MEKFYFISHDNHDAYFNLASEEYLLKQKDGYYFYLWINSPAVIVGTNQNAVNEVNLSYVQDNGIKVVRRLTGGGAVYHDNGNLCYTVIAPYNGVDDYYKKFTAPVIEYLKSMGVNAEFGGRNDILIDGKKISGNAQTVYKDRIMHHGTILFNTDTSVLSKALNPSKLKLESKGIKSVRSRVVNVKDYLPNFSIEQFKDGLKQRYLLASEEYKFTDEDIQNIKKLVDEKYSRYEWNIGRSPKGKTNFERKFSFGILNLSFDIENGLIENAEIFGDFFSKKDVLTFSKSLNGTRFEKSALITAFDNIGEYIDGANGIEVANALFE